MQKFITWKVLDKMSNVAVCYHICKVTGKDKVKCSTIDMTAVRTLFLFGQFFWRNIFERHMLKSVRKNGGRCIKRKTFNVILQTGTVFRCFTVQFQHQQDTGFVISSFNAWSVFSRSGRIKLYNIVNYGWCCCMTVYLINILTSWHFLILKFLILLQCFQTIKLQCEWLLSLTKLLQPQISVFIYIYIYRVFHDFRA